jgi:hypothetical protein
MNQMTSTAMTANTNGMTYAQCIEASRRMRWDIDADVLRGRQFDTADKFLPDGLTGMGDGCTLSADDQRLISQIQGRTYAGISALPSASLMPRLLRCKPPMCLTTRRHWRPWCALAMKN